MLSADLNHEFQVSCLFTNSNHFQTDIDNLPSLYNTSTSQTFADFFAKWGTHFITQATMGGRTSFRTYVTRSQEQTWSENNVDAIAGLEMAFAASVGISVPTSDKNYQAISQSDLEIVAFGLGGYYYVIQ
jgi:hypothetical protein